MSVMRRFVWALPFFVASSAPAQESAVPKTTNVGSARVPVGMVGRIDQVVIPGGEVEAVPADDPLAKVMVRVVETYRHGDGHRYDLEFTGFEPGRIDLAQSLRRKSPDEKAPPIPPIEVEITSELEPGRIEPTRPGTPVIRGWVTYWTKLNVFIGLWIAGLGLLMYWSNRAEPVIDEVASRPPPTLAERLEPLVRAACDGTIEPHRRAELERLLIGFWSDRLNLSDSVATGQELTALKQHPEAGPLVRQLEKWLHAPPGDDRMTDAEIAALLKPYESASAGSLLLAEAGSTKGVV